MENIEIKLNRAVELLEEENFLEAREVLKQVIEVDETNIEAYKNLGLCEVSLDNPNGAIDAFLKACELDSNDATSLFYLANCYNRIGDKETSIQKFEEVLKLRPNFLDAYKSMAMIYIEFAQVDNAIEIANRALNNPEIEGDYSLYYILATSYMLKKDNLKSIEFLSKAFELNNTNLSIANSLAVCYMNINDYENANKILNTAYEIDSNNSLTLYNLGILNQTKGDFQKALGYFQESYKLEPTITMLATLANCALNAQEYQMAQKMYENLVAVYPNNTEYRLAYIEALENVRENQKALDNINFLLEMDQKNIALTKKKGTNLRKLGLYDESIETFNTLIKRGKIDVEVYYNLAYNYVEVQDYDNAKEMFKKCIILEPNNPYAHKDLGVLYLKMNCYEWAVDEMLEAIKLEDDVAEFYYSLGVAHMMLSNLEEAKKAFEDSLKLDNKNPDCLAYYGYLKMLYREYDQAQEILKLALSIDSTNFLAKIHSAKLYFALQKYETAKELILDSIQTTSDDETMNMLGVCYMQTNEFENAMGIFFKLSLTYPKNHILLTNLAKCEAKCNKIKEANEHLRQALMIYDDYQEALELLEEINNGK